MRDSLEVTTRWRTAELQKYFDHLQAPRLNQALSRAVNDAAKQVERVAERIVAQRTSLPAERTKKGVYIRPASKPSTLSTTIKGSSSVVPLKVFHAKEVPGGTTAKIWGTRTMHPDAFIEGGVMGRRVELPMGGHVFVRRGKTWVSPGKRGGIQKAKGAAISEAMNEGAVKHSIERVADQRLAANVLRQLDRATRRARGKF